MRFFRRKGFWVVGVTLSAIHLGATFYCILVSFAASMTSFDNPELQPNWLEELLGDVADVLIQPMKAILGFIGARGMSSTAEWAAMAANSSLWGFGLSYVIYGLTRRWGEHASARRSPLLR